MKKKFLRSNTKNYKRLGRKKLLRWRKPKGHDNKIRLNRKGKRRKVVIGFRTNKKDRGKIKGKSVILIKNLKQAEKINRGELIIISGKLGKKKKQEIEKKIKEQGGVIARK